MELEGRHHPEAEGEQPEREPQPSDVVAACRAIVAELAPDADPEDVEANIKTIARDSDLQEALGNAAGFFVMHGIDPDVGAARLGEILQVEAVLPYGDD